MTSVGGSTGNGYRGESDTVSLFKPLPDVDLIGALLEPATVFSLIPLAFLVCWLEPL